MDGGKVREMKISGCVTQGEYAYQQKVYVKPIAHQYSDDPSNQYTKYSCPVCESLKNRFSIPWGLSNCPQCNVNLIWTEV